AFTQSAIAYKWRVLDYSRRIEPSAPKKSKPARRAICGHATPKRNTKGFHRSIRMGQLLTWRSAVVERHHCRAAGTRRDPPISRPGGHDCVSTGMWRCLQSYTHRDWDMA